MLLDRDTHTHNHPHGHTHKQVEHNIRYDDIEGAEVDEGAGVVAAVRLPVSMHVWSAEGGLHLGLGETDDPQITLKVNMQLRKLNSQLSHITPGSRNFTMQSCMILFQSSPVTIRNSTVMALPAVEKLACL